MSIASDDIHTAPADASPEPSRRDFLVATGIKTAKAVAKVAAVSAGTWGRHGHKGENAVHFIPETALDIPEHADESLRREYDKAKRALDASLTVANNEVMAVCKKLILDGFLSHGLQNTLGFTTPFSKGIEFTIIPPYGENECAMGLSWGSQTSQKKIALPGLANVLKACIRLHQLDKQYETHHQTPPLEGRALHYAATRMVNAFQRNSLIKLPNPESTEQTVAKKLEAIVDVSLAQTGPAPTPQAQAEADRRMFKMFETHKHHVYSGHDYHPGRGITFYLQRLNPHTGFVMHDEVFLPFPSKEALARLEKPGMPSLGDGGEKMLKALHKRAGMAHAARERGWDGEDQTLFGGVVLQVRIKDPTLHTHQAEASMILAPGRQTQR